MLNEAAGDETLTRLTRLAQRRPECESWITEALHGRMQHTETALDVAVESGDPVGKKLASELQFCDDLERLEAVAELCAAFEPQLALSLSNFGKALSEIGEHHNACWATRESVEIFRRLTQNGRLFGCGSFRTGDSWLKEA